MSRNNNFNRFGRAQSLYGGIVQQTEQPKWIKQGKKWKRKQPKITDKELQQLKAEYYSK
jgi:hypothetical protein